MAKTLVLNQEDQGSIPFTMWNMYVNIYIYHIHVCKCIVPGWVVDR
jgi:hypothetical protein